MSFNLKSTPLIGMLHLPRLRYDSPSNLDDMIEYSLQEVGKLSDLGFHGVMIENFNDTPFEKSRVSDYVYTKFTVILRDILELWSKHHWITTPKC